MGTFAGPKWDIKPCLTNIRLQNVNLLAKYWPLRGVVSRGIRLMKNNFCSWSSGFEIAPHGIMKPVKRHASLTGEAYVKFASKEIAEKALTRHNEYMGSR